jgi:hypothetical protein
LLILDPDIKTRDEYFTPLHFAARYMPQIAEIDVQTLERSSSKQVVEFLVNYRDGMEVQASDLYLCKQSAFHDTPVI